MTLRDLHNKAMEQYDAGLVARMNQDYALWRKRLREAYALEGKAATRLLHNHDCEPTRSTLYLGAARIALQLGMLDRAESAASQGLAGKPSEYNARALRALLDLIPALRKSGRLGDWHKDPSRASITAP